MYVMKRTFCVIAALLLALSLCACEQKAPEGPTWQEQYDLGVKYLSEGNYQEAIIAFTAAIEIDPKRPEAYAGLADVYAAQGDMDSLRAILEQGVEATGNSGLRSRLDSLDESGGSTAETYDFQTRVTAAGLDVDAEHLTVRVRDSRTAAITVSGLDLRDSYPTNLASSEENEDEYMWEVVIHGQQATYSVSTSFWAFTPGTEDETALADMQHSVWVHTGDSFHYIGDAQMTYTADSITWTFTVAEEYPFDFAKVDRYEVRVRDVSQDLTLTRDYTLE